MDVEKPNPLGWAFETGLVLVKPELNFYVDDGCDGIPIFSTGLKLPLIDGFDGLFVQAQAKAALHANVVRTAIGSNHQLDHANALIFCFARFFRVFGVGFEDNFGGAHSSANLEGTAAGSAAVALANARAAADTNSAPAAGSDSAAGAGAV